MSKQFVDLLLKEQLITQGDHNSANEAFQKTKTPHLKFLQQHNLVNEQKIVEYFAKKYSVTLFYYYYLYLARCILRSFPLRVSLLCL